MSADTQPGRRGDPDVVVVGAGPAGLVTALAGADRGLSVRVLDRRRTPIDKACGEGLMPDAVAILHALGVALPEHRPIHGIRYLDDEHCVEGRFPALPGAGVRRTELHRALLERARDVEIDVRERVRVTGLRPSGSDPRGTRWALETDDGPVAPGWIVGADGLHSNLRGWSGLARGELRFAPRRFGIRRHFRVPPWSDLVEVYWADGREAYVTPVAADEVGIAVLWARPVSTRASSDAPGPGDGGDRGDRGGRVEDGGTFDRLLRSFPVLAERLVGADAVSPVMAAGPFRQRTRGVTAGNLALVGDAAGYVDAITGEGMALAFHEGVALAEALAAGDLASYRAAHRRHRRVPNLFTEAALGLSRSPRLRRRALTALAAEPALFDRILGVHSGDAVVRTLVAPSLARGAVHLVTGH